MMSNVVKFARPAPVPVPAPLPTWQTMTGYRPVYRPGTSCPCCTGTAWLLGRSSAECARCGAALPFDHTNGEAQ